MFRQVWWHPKVEYGAGLNAPRTWRVVMDQYRRPTDLRHYDLPVERYTEKLYYEYPRMGIPEYRGKFRDKPHTVTSYYPQCIDTKPVGFHGRVYYEDGPPRMKYDGPAKNSLYWLENPGLQPVFPKPKAEHSAYETHRGINLNPIGDNHHALRHLTNVRRRSSGPRHWEPPMLTSSASEGLTPRFHSLTRSADKCPNKLSQDGVGYL